MENINLSDQLIQAIRKRTNQSTSTDDEQKLIDQGVDVNSQVDGAPPLGHACMYSDYHCVRLFLDNGAKVDAPFYGGTPLHILSAKRDSNSIECFKLLLKYGANINICNSSTETPLQCAVRNNNTECVQLILQHGANINVGDKDNRTPLHWAAMHNNTECVKRLLELVPDVNVGDKNKRTPLHWAVMKNNIKCAELLIQHGANVNVGISNYDAPLTWAVQHKHIECLKLLLKNGAEVNLCDNDNVTPLHWAVRENNIESVTLLLQHGAKTDVRDIDHTTVLNQAAKICNLEIIRILLEYNANVNNIDLYGHTSLMLAALKARRCSTGPEVLSLELLIQASGQFDLRDENGELRPDLMVYIDDDEKRELRKRLIPYCVNPRSLMELCRYEIRSNLHQQFLPDVITSLNLPKKLERFVLLQ